MYTGSQSFNLKKGNSLRKLGLEEDKQEDNDKQREKAHDPLLIR